MDGMSLFRKAKSAGLKVMVDGTTLKIRGPKKAESIAQQLLANKEMVLDELNRNKELDTRVILWDPETESLIQWFLDEGQYRLPTESFQLTPWQRVNDPEHFKEAILFGISVGPETTALRHGTFTADLRRLKELFHHGNFYQRRKQHEE
ncbi:MAG: hypothetical protein ABIK28_04430 [Planctomycetota bacterium]